MKHYLVFALLAACEKDLIGELPDAGPDLDAPALSGCPAPADPTAPGNFKLYLNTEGVTLNKNNCSPDRQSVDNCSPLVKADGTVVPPFLDGQTGREAFIAEVAAKTQTQLAAYSIDVVTTRPATGPYYMFVLGGTPLNVAGTCDGCLSITPFACAGGVPLNTIDLMFDVGVPNAGMGPKGSNFYAWTIASDLGAMVGMMNTTDANDCECRGGPCANETTQVTCTFGEAANVAANNCGVTGTQNEPAILEAKLGCR